jgi:hypothetical protein
MTVKLKSLRANLERENAGDWIAAPDIGPGVEFKVRGINFPEFRALRDREAKRLAAQYGSEPIPEHEADAATGRLLAEHILLDWKGFDEPYTKDMASDMLKDPAYRELRQAVVSCAVRITEVKVQFTEEAAKNSAPPSAKS